MRKEYLLKELASIYEDCRQVRASIYDASLRSTINDACWKIKALQNFINEVV